MTTVKLEKALARSPAVHAFVIGVGDYPFLEGGSKKPIDKPTWGLGQLTSAPRSALEMANWLATDFELPAIGPHPARPLASIELLVSQAGGSATFADPSAGVGADAIAVERATMHATTAAFSDWFDRAHSHED